MQLKEESIKSGRKCAHLHLGHDSVNNLSEESSGGISQRTMPGDVSEQISKELGKEK